MNAGWMLNEKEGATFLAALANNDNIRYFGIESIRFIINY